METKGRGNIMYSRTIMRIIHSGWNIALKFSLAFGLYKQPAFYIDSNNMLHHFRKWAFITPFCEFTWWRFKTEYQT